MNTRRLEIVGYVIVLIWLLLFLMWPTILRWQIDRAIDKALAQELEKMVGKALKTP